MSLSQAADDYVQFPITIQIGGDHRVRDGLPILELGPGAEAAFCRRRNGKYPGQGRR
jgi:hypothetical protein